MNKRFLINQILFRFSIAVIICLPLIISAESHPNNSSNFTSELKFDARLYPANNDYIEIRLDTRNFLPNTCFRQISVEVALLDKRGQTVQNKTFNLHEKILEKGVYIDWFPHGLPSIQAAKGKRIIYNRFNCGIAHSPKSRSFLGFFRSLLGIKSKAEKKEIEEAKIKHIEEGVEEIEFSPDDEIEQLSQPPERKAP